MRTTFPILTLTAAHLPATTSQTNAGLLSRFVAAAIDTLIVGTVSVPVAFWIQASGIPVTFATLVAVLVGGAVFSLLNFRRLENTGQTIGKKITGIRIVGSRGEKLTAEDILVTRYAPLWCLALVPVLGGAMLVINAALVLGQKRACGHDLIAKTRVIKI